MNTSYMEEFLILKQTESFEDAALELGISQSTLSRHIQALEKEIGKPLINRNSHTFQLTRAGSAFSIYSLTMQEARRNFVADLRSFSSSESGKIKIGIVHGTEQYPLSELLLEFHKTEPELQFSIYNAKGSELVHQLYKGEVDLIIVWDLDSPGEGQRNILFEEDTYVLQIPPGHPMYGKESVNLSQLQNEQIMIRSPKYSRTLVHIYQECQDLGFDINLIPKPGYWLSNKDNLLYLILKKQVTRNQYSEAFSIADIYPPLKQRLVFKYQPNTLSRQAAVFVDFLNKYLDK